MRQVLQYSNVDTFIVFRASTPLLISVADYLFLGRELPSLRSVRAYIPQLDPRSLMATFDASFNTCAPHRRSYCGFAPT